MTDWSCGYCLEEIQVLAGGSFRHPFIRASERSGSRAGLTGRVCQFVANPATESQGTGWEVKLAELASAVIKGARKP